MIGSVKRAIILESKITDPAVSMATQACIEARGFPAVRAGEAFESANLGFSSWTDHVGAGVDYVTREPTFTFLVLPDVRMGKVTAAIVRQALSRCDRLVLIYVDGDLLPVRGVFDENPQSWRDGWTAVY